MIFTSESGLVEPSRRAEWDLWYLDHLAAMASVPGIVSAQRFRALDAGPPPSLAMYTVAGPAVFESEVYLRKRGMGPWLELIDRRFYRRNLFDGLEAAPVIPAGGTLAVVDRQAAGEPIDGLVWLRAVAIDRSPAFRGVAVFPGAAVARRWAAGIEGPVALYRTMTERLSGPEVG